MSEREELADALDEIHNDCITEGGCGFSGWTRGWRVGDDWAPSPSVDELIAKGVRKITVDDEMVERAAKALWVASQDDIVWAAAVVDDVFSPADDWPQDALDIANTVRVVLEAALSTEGSSDE